MKATQTDLTKDLKAGWYKIKANFSEMTDLEKMVDSMNQMTAQIYKLQKENADSLPFRP